MAIIAAITPVVPANSNETVWSSVSLITGPTIEPPTGQSQSARGSKTDLIVKALRRSKGATITQLAALTGWQPHSVRGFLSGTVRKKLGLNLVSDIGADGQRRYRIMDATNTAD